MTRLPRSRCGSSQHQWLAECFPDNEAAVIIHEDNKERMGRGEEL